MFWDRLETLCQIKGMKPQSIRNKIGISSGVITSWKNGTIPNGETLIKLSNFFDCSIDYLLGLDDVPNRREETVPFELTSTKVNSEANLVPNGYNKYYVAFLDILGFKEIVKNDDFEKINSLIGKYNKKYILGLLNYGLDDSYYDEPDSVIDSLKIVQFSDSIIISVPSDMYYSFDTLLLVLRDLIADCLLNHNILLRGGIAEGDFYIDDNKLFGTALNQAYNLENSSAIYPRVIFTEKLLNNYENKCLGSMLCKGITEIDKDGYYFVDYLFSLNWDLHLRSENKVWVKKYKNINEDIKSAYKKTLAEETNNYVREKYIWLKHYYKETQIKIKSYFDRLPEKEKSTSLTIEVETPTREIRHSYYKVSAGTGYDLNDDNQWDTIEIPDTPESQRADFALTISGDSMEPIYYDGDIVLIKSQPAVDDGEIGIFIIENNGFIKKYGGDRLISLNAAYDDIMFSDYDPDDIRCVGLVIGRV